jgi:ribosomal protein S3AE
VKYKFDYSIEKDLILKEIRGIGFEDLIDAINKGGLLDRLEHFNKQKYPHQKILVIKCKNYIYALPCVIDKNKKTIFLKTIYPSRDLTRKYLKK